MKVTTLRCPSCGGTLRIHEKNPMLAQCEYCKTSIVLEWENNQPHLSQKEGYKTPQDLLYEIENQQNSFDWKRNLVGSIAILLFMALIAIFMAWSGRQTKEEGTALKEWQAKTAHTMTEEEEPQKVVLSGNLEELVSVVFGISAQEVPEEELAKIKWLEMKYTQDQRMIGYSFGLPGEEGAELTWITFPRNSELGQEGLCRFTGLKRLSVNGTIRPGDLKGLKLESIGGYFYSAQEVAELVDDVSTLKEIRFLLGVESLDEVGQFSNLEQLFLGSSELTEVDVLRTLPNLKRLELIGFDDLSDFSLLGTLDGLVELSLDSENLKTLNFLSGMKSLRRLEIIGGKMLSLDGMEERPELEALIISDCHELKDMNAVEQLSSLKELSLEVPYGCPEPQLEGLMELKHVTLSGFRDCSGIETLKQLENLTLDSCYFSHSPDLSGLTNLKELKYRSFSARGLNVAFITEIPALEKLDMEGISSYEDISGIFNMKNLKELDISGMECEIDFDRVQENQTLESLFMDELILYENAQVSKQGAITYVNWDDVVLDEHTEFLGRFQALKHLNIKNNQLTDLSFVSGMTMLETIDITDNYITEIRPLAELQHLQEVIAIGNPISNRNALGSQVSLVFE